MACCTLGNKQQTANTSKQQSVKQTRNNKQLYSKHKQTTNNNQLNKQQTANTGGRLPGPCESLASD
jgi:hypothetical protein